MRGYNGRIYVEDGGLPNVGAHLLKCWKNAGGLRQRLYEKASDLTDFSDMIPWFGQSIDAADGEFSLRSRYVFWRARSRLNWNPQGSLSALDTFNDVHVAMTLATGGEPMPLATWRRLRTLVTPHPLGGSVAAAEGAGVTTDTGQVHGLRNLFVIDGSIIPRAIGRNPSKTIAALAERGSQKLVGTAQPLEAWVSGDRPACVDVGHVLPPASAVSSGSGASCWTWAANASSWWAYDSLAPSRSTAVPSGVLMLSRSSSCGLALSAAVAAMGSACAGAAADTTTPSMPDASSSATESAGFAPCLAATAASTSGRSSATMSPSTPSRRTASRCGRRPCGPVNHPERGDALRSSS